MNRQKLKEEILTSLEWCDFEGFRDCRGLTDQLIDHVDQYAQGEVEAYKRTQHAIDKGMSFDQLKKIIEHGGQFTLIETENYYSVVDVDQKENWQGSSAYIAKNSTPGFSPLVIFGDAELSEDQLHAFVKFAYSQFKTN